MRSPIRSVWLCAALVGLAAGLAPGLALAQTKTAGAAWQLSGQVVPAGDLVDMVRVTVQFQEQTRCASRSPD